MNKIVIAYALEPSHFLDLKKEAERIEKEKREQLEEKRRLEEEANKPAETAPVEGEENKPEEVPQVPTYTSNYNMHLGGESSRTSRRSGAGRGRGGTMRSILYSFL